MCLYMFAVGQFAVGQIAVGTPKIIQELDIFLGLMDHMHI